MAESQQVSSLPLPPMHYAKEYTDEAVRRGVAPRPPPPLRDHYLMFGNPFHCDDVIIRPLESQGIARLYPPDVDHKRELKKLNVSILVNFLDLLDVLVRGPSSVRRDEKLEDLKLLFVHMHHLVNEFRPHQARETLRVLLEVQRRTRLDTAQRFSRQLDAVHDLLSGCLAALGGGGEGTGSAGETAATAGTGGGEATCTASVKVEPSEEPMEVTPRSPSHPGSGPLGQTGPTPNAGKEANGAMSDKDALMCRLVDELT
ncbi:mediator of RNA polymerase II transcription subunit 7 [Lampetra fluviatilis]